MIIFLGGINGLHGIIDMIIYLAGGVSGNLNPAWRRMAKDEISCEAFERALIHENFWLGGKVGTGYRTNFRP